MKALFLLSPALFVCAAAPALAKVVVSSPQSSARVSSPFWLGANADPCWSQNITSMGYSIDDSTYTGIVPGSAVNRAVDASVGSHLLHVKSWGVYGAVCVTDVAITVVRSPVESVPAYATVTREIQAWKGWRHVNDTGAGPGKSHGNMSLDSWPSLSG